MRRLVASALLVAACVAGLSSSAVAAGGLPKGKYYCRYYDESTMGVITVKSATKYTYSNGKGGKYKRTGSKLKFTSGPMKGVFKHGTFKSGSTGTYFLLFDGATWGHAYTDATCMKMK